MTASECRCRPEVGVWRTSCPVEFHRTIALLKRHQALFPRRFVGGFRPAAWNRTGVIREGSYIKPDGMSDDLARALNAPHMHAVDMSKPLPRVPWWKRVRWAFAGIVMVIGAWVQRRSGITWRDGAGAYVGWRGRVAHLGGRIWRAGERWIG